MTMLREKKRERGIDMNYNKLPQELTANKNFGVYRLDKKEEEKNGHKYDKKPIVGTSKAGWKSFPDALKAFYTLKAAASECGFLLAYFLGGDDGIHFLDLDNIRNDVQECMNKRVSEDNLIRRVMLLLGHTYTEYSSSGNGVHIFFRVEEKLPHKDKVGDIELYDEKRGIALTGNTLFGASWPVKTISVETYKQLIQMLGLEQPKEKPRATAVPPKHRSTQVPNNWTEQDAWNSLEHDNAHGSLIADILRGTTPYTALNTDHSGAEITVCNCLAYHTRGNTDMMYNMLINSPLITDKDMEKDHYTEYKGLTLLEVRIIQGLNWLRDNPKYSNWVA